MDISGPFLTPAIRHLNKDLTIKERADEMIVYAMNCNSLYIVFESFHAKFTNGPYRTVLDYDRDKTMRTYLWELKNSFSIPLKTFVLYVH